MGSLSLAGVQVEVFQFPCKMHDVESPNQIEQPDSDAVFMNSESGLGCRLCFR